jgi:PII-like signaling protein
MTASNAQAYSAGELLRIYVGERDKTHGRSTYQVVVETAHKLGLAGATVLQGSLGFGATSVVHRRSFWSFSENTPLVVEIVDIPEKIEAFIPALEELLRHGGLITLEQVQMSRGAEASR